MTVKRFGPPMVVIQGLISALQRSMQGDQMEINDLYRVKTDIGSIQFTTATYSTMAESGRDFFKTPAYLDANQIRVLDQDKRTILNLIDQRIIKENEELADKQKIIAFLQKVVLMPT